MPNLPPLYLKNGAALMGADGMIFGDGRCPGAVATVSLSSLIHVRGGFSWQPAALVGTWHRPDYYGEDDPCKSATIPGQVLSIAGVRDAPCLDVPLSSGTDPADYPDEFSAVSVLSFGGASLRSSATTPTSVAQLDGDGKGSAVVQDSDSSDETECDGSVSAVSTAAQASLDISNSPEDVASWGLVGMEARSTIQASASATASLRTCGCCRERTMNMGVSMSGGNSACTQEIILDVSTQGGRALEISGSFNASVQPNQTLRQTINASSAAIVVRWRG